MKFVVNLPCLAQVAILSAINTVIGVAGVVYIATADTTSISPQTQPQCTQYCPIGNSGQPAGPIGR